MDSDGNRLQNSCSPRHWGHSTMHRVRPVPGTTTTMTLCIIISSVGRIITFLFIMQSCIKFSFHGNLQCMKSGFSKLCTTVPHSNTQITSSMVAIWLVMMTAASANFPISFISLACSSSPPSNVAPATTGTRPPAFSTTRLAIFTRSSLLNWGVERVGYGGKLHQPITNNIQSRPLVVHSATTQTSLFMETYTHSARRNNRDLYFTGALIIYAL